MSAVRVARATGALRGRIRVPGSKSLSTRAIVLACLCPDGVLLRDLLLSDDTQHLLGAAASLGAGVSRLMGTDWRVDAGTLRSDARSVEVNLGDGGAPTRFTMALAALRRGATVIDGSDRMRERPIADGVRLLRELGVRVESLGADDRLPLRVHGIEPRSSESNEPAPTLVVGRTASSQFISALMLVAPGLPRGLGLRFTQAPTSASYLDLTIDALRDFGAGVRGRAHADGDELVIEHGLRAPRVFQIAADASSAVVWVAAAAMVPGSRIELEGVVRDHQPDVMAIEALGRMGARLEWRREGLVVEHAPLRGIDVDAEAWPDGTLAVAAAASVARGPTRLRSLGTLRVKESDRLSALSKEFGSLGIGVAIEGDDLIVSGGSHRDARVHSVEDRAPAATPSERRADVVVDVHRDHRMAMALALVGLRRGGVVMADPGCVAKSYPRFWQDLGVLSKSIVSQV